MIDVDEISSFKRPSKKEKGSLFLRYIKKEIKIIGGFKCFQKFLVRIWFQGE